MYSAEPFEYLFDTSCDGLSAAFLRHDGVGNYRVKKIKAGPSSLEVEVFPIWPCWSTVRRARTVGNTSAAQQAVNERNAKKRFARLVETNFGPGDLHVTLTYVGRADAITEDQAKKDVKNYLRRVGYWRRKHGMPPSKYLYVVEFREEGDAKGEEPVRIHHHIIMTGMDRSVAEGLWKKGFANADALQPNEDGLKGLSLYLMKNPKGRKRWGWSKNLKEPTVTWSDKSMSKRQVARIVDDIAADGRAIMERLFRGYYVVGEIEVRRSDYVDGAYIYVSMRKRPDTGQKKSKSDNRTPKTTRTCAHVARARDS